MPIVWVSTIERNSVLVRPTTAPAGTGLMQVPILGTLFRSRDYINKQTELMVIVTPYIVRAVAQKDLSRPDDGFADAPDPATILLGKLNRIYGAAGHVDPGVGYHGSYGFILD
jgi:pilus assembly protein CpaC